MSTENTINPESRFLAGVGFFSSMGAAAGATLGGPIGAAGGALAGALIACSGSSISHIAKLDKNSSPLKKTIVLAISFFANVGITMGITKITFTAACIFIGVSAGYGLAAIVAIAILAIFLKAMKHRFE